MKHCSRAQSLALFIFLLTLTLAAPCRADQDKVVLTTEDGYWISGLLTIPEDFKGGRAVVMLHMFKNTKESWQPLIRVLTERGIASLAIDLRGHGQSTVGPDGKDVSHKVNARSPAFFNTMYQDAEAAVRYLQALDSPVDKIALIGASVGCSVAIHTVTRGKAPIKAVVAMTPGSKYLGVPTMKHIGSWPSPLPLLIMSSEEEAEKGAQIIHQKLKGKGAELVLYDEEDIHGTFMFGEVEGVESAITDWLVKKM